MSVPHAPPSHTLAVYRPDIDGLRAVAVLSVLIFHLHPQALQGGFVGVDMFFVLSGYLISGILFRGLQDGTLSLVDFYIHRVKRIFPALLTVLLACLVAGWWILLPGEYAQLSKHVAAGGAFVQNFVLQQEAGYFDNAAELKPLLHLWSLAIEEQFYLVYPLLLITAWRLRLTLLWVVSLLGAVSFVWNLHDTTHHPVGAYFSPQTRFWELLAGAVLAHLQTFGRDATRWRSPPAVLGHTLSLAGLLLVLVSVFWIDKGKAFPGWWAVLPVLGTVMLVAAGSQACANRLLSRRPLVWVGLISYPLYLWHWPILSFLRIRLPEGPSAALLGAAVGTSFTFAIVTYLAVERPIRFRCHWRLVPPALASGMVVMAAAGFITLRLDGLPGRIPAEIRTIANFKVDFATDARAGKCWLSNTQPADAFADECTDLASTERPAWLLWGDSHAARLFPGLRHVTNGQVAWSQFNRDGCAPVPGLGYERCQESNEHVLARLSAIRPELVIMFSHWGARATDWGPHTRHAQQLLDSVRRLHGLGVPRIVVLGPAPRWNEALPKMVYQSWLGGLPRKIPLRMADGLKSEVTAIDAQLASLLRDETVDYVSVWNILCDGDGCLTHVPGQAAELMSWDYGHLTTPGAILLAQALKHRGLLSR